MGSRAEIRGMRIDDLRAVFLLGSRLYGTGIPGEAGGWNEQNLAGILSECLDTSFVAVNKKEIVGYLIAGTGHAADRPRAARIFWLGAAGTGKAAVSECLLQSFIDILRERDIDRITIKLDGRNSELIDLARKFGFTESKHVLIMENFLSKRDP